jgi:hypothetical protein
LYDFTIEAIPFEYGHGQGGSQPERDKFQAIQRRTKGHRKQPQLLNLLAITAIREWLLGEKLLFQMTPIKAPMRSSKNTSTNRIATILSMLYSILFLEFAIFGIYPPMLNETTNCDPNNFQTIDEDDKNIKNSLSVYASTFPIQK